MYYLLLLNLDWTISSLYSSRYTYTSYETISCYRIQVTYSLNRLKLACWHIQDLKPANNSHIYHLSLSANIHWQVSDLSESPTNTQQPSTKVWVHQKSLVCLCCSVFFPLLYFQTTQAQTAELPSLPWHPSARPSLTSTPRFFNINWPEYGWTWVEPCWTYWKLLFPVAWRPIADCCSFDGSFSTIPGGGRQTFRGGTTNYGSPCLQVSTGFARTCHFHSGPWSLYPIELTSTPWDKWPPLSLCNNFYQRPIGFWTQGFFSP